MVTTAAVADAVIKDIFYGEGATAQMRDYNPTLDLFDGTDEDIEGGSNIKFPIQKQFQQGLGARSEGEDLPIPGKSNYVGCSFALKKLTMSIQITTEAWQKTKKKGLAAFVNLLTEQAIDVRGGYLRDRNAMMFGDGTGLKTTVTAAATQGSDVVVTVASTKKIYEGMLIDIYERTTDTTPVDSDVEVLSVDVLNSQITLKTLAADIADDSCIYRAGNKDREPNGLIGIVNDAGGAAVVQGITVASNPIWEANVLDNAGTTRPITDNLMDLATRAGRPYTQRNPDAIIMGEIQARKYANLQLVAARLEKSQKQGKVVLDGGYEKIQYKGIPITEDPDCDDDIIFFLQIKGQMKFWQLSKQPEFLYSPDSKHMWYRLEGKGMFRADAEQFIEFGTKRRNTQTKLADLETAG